MSVKIIIQRKFKAPLIKEDIQMIEGFRFPAMKQNGYVSGETLIDLKNSKNTLVISTWTDFDSFSTWFHGDERKKLKAQLTPLLDEPEKINFYYLGADALNNMFDTIVHDFEMES